MISWKLKVGEAGKKFFDLHIFNQKITVIEQQITIRGNVLVSCPRYPIKATYINSNQRGTYD
jgi:hypothetical protein